MESDLCFSRLCNEFNKVNYILATVPWKLCPEQIFHENIAKCACSCLKYKYKIMPILLITGIDLSESLGGLLPSKCNLMLTCLFMVGSSLYCAHNR